MSRRAGDPDILYSNSIKSKKILEDISGDEVITFRAPAARVQKNTAVALEKTGYKIDSSI